MSLRIINTKIKEIAEGGQKLNVLIHDTAVMVLKHVQQHRDATVALRLVQAMPASYRRTMMVQWFSQYSPIGLNVGGGKCLIHKEGSKAYHEWDVDGGKANPFYEMAARQREAMPDTTLSDIKQAIIRLVKRAEKAIEEGHVADADKDGIVDIITKVRPLAA